MHQPRTPPSRGRGFSVAPLPSTVEGYKPTALRLYSHNKKKILTQLLFPPPPTYPSLPPARQPVEATEVLSAKKAMADAEVLQTGEKIRSASADLASLIDVFSGQLQKRLDELRKAERSLMQQQSELARRTTALNQREQALNAREAKLRDTGRGNGQRGGVNPMPPPSTNQQPQEDQVSDIARRADLQLLASATAAALLAHSL